MKRIPRLVIPLFAAVLIAAEEAPSADDTKYKIELNGTTTEVGAGEKGRLRLRIQPAEGFKISSEAPLKIGLEANLVQMEKDALGHQDAEDAKSTSPVFSVGFSTKAAGNAKIVANAMFFVCDETMCERRRETVTVAINVKPGS